MNEILEKKRVIFCNTLKSIRTEYNISQTELARRMGVTQSYISKLERGKRGIEIFELMDYCQAMGISLTQFSARFEWKLGLEFPSNKAQMKFFLSVLHSFNIT